MPRLSRRSLFAGVAMALPLVAAPLLIATPVRCTSGKFDPAVELQAKIVELAGDIQRQHVQIDRLRRLLDDHAARLLRLAGMAA